MRNTPGDRRRNSLVTSVWVLVFGLAAILPARPAAAVDYTWINPWGGSFGDGSAWSPEGPPGPSDAAFFTLPRPGYTVTLDGDYANDRLLVDGGEVTLDLEGHTYALTHDFFSDNVHSAEIGSNAGQLTSTKLTVTNGTVAALHTILGHYGTNTGELVVSSGGYWDSSDAFDTVGGDGVGRLTISQGGRFDSFYMFVAFNVEARGSILVTGSGSLWDNPWFAVLGRFGNAQGEISVQSGGEARIGQVMLGETTSASGVLRVGGAGSLCNLVFTPNSDKSLIVGEGGTGMVTVENTARLVCSQNAVVGNLAGSSGAVVVQGVGSRMDVVQGLYVGREGRGSLDVLDGALVTVAERLAVAGYDNAEGRVSVEGAGSRLLLAQGLSLGGDLDSGGVSNTAAQLTISNGGYVSVAGDVNYGLNSTSHVGGLVSGPGSTLSIDGSLLMGQFNGPTTTLVIEEGGLVRAQNLLAAPDAAAEATILVAGLGSRLVARDSAFLGGIDASTPGGAATVQLIEGGALETAGSTIVHGSSRIVFAGGTLRSPSYVSNRGLITGFGQIAAPLENAPPGEVRGDMGGSLVFSGWDNVNFGTIRLQGGAIEFAGALVNEPGAVICGRGVLQTGGLENQGSIAFSVGISDVIGDLDNQAGGRVITSGGATTVFWDDVVHNGAEIRTSAGCATVFFGSVSGSGPYTGAGVVSFEGDLKPGSSPAAVSFGGDVVFGSAASLQIELAGRASGSQYDTLAVAGAASLDGELAVRLLGAFRPRVGDRFTVMTYANRLGEFASYDGLFQGDVPLVPVYRAGDLTLVATYPGDANADGQVSDLDASILAAHWQQLSGARWGDGDFNGDGRVTDLDASILAAHWQAGVGSTAVPEPAVGVTFLGAIALAVATRRLRRHFTRQEPAGLVY